MASMLWCDQVDVQDDITRFVSEQLLEGDSDGLDATTPLLTLGIIDSLSMISLLAFVGGHFGVHIRDDDVLPEHFATIETLSALVVRLSQQDDQEVRIEAATPLQETVRVLTHYGIERQHWAAPSGDRMHALHVHGAKPTWVLLPALGSPSSSYGLLLRSIMGEQEAMAIDLAGFGLSDSAIAQPAYTDHLHSCLALLEHTVEPPLVVIGNSAGSMLATEIVRRHPEWVQALIITGFGLIDDGMAWWKGLQATSQGAQAFLGKTYYHPPKLTHDVHSALRDVLSSPAYHSFLDATALDAMRTTFDDLDVPTLFVAGEHDGIIPRAAVMAAVERVPGARLEWLARCGHFPPAERPDEFVYVVRHFLASL